MMKIIWLTVILAWMIRDTVLADASGINWDDATDDAEEELLWTTVEGEQVTMELARMLEGNTEGEGEGGGVVTELPTPAPSSPMLTPGPTPAPAQTCADNPLYILEGLTCSLLKTLLEQTGIPCSQLVDVAAPQEAQDDLILNCPATCGTCTATAPPTEVQTALPTELPTEPPPTPATSPTPSPSSPLSTSVPTPSVTQEGTPTSSEIERLCQARASCHAFVIAGVDCDTDLADLCQLGAAGDEGEGEAEKTYPREFNGDRDNFEYDYDDGTIRNRSRNSEQHDEEFGEYEGWSGGGYGGGYRIVPKKTLRWVSGVTLRGLCIDDGFPSVCPVPWIWSKAKTEDICIGYISKCQNAAECSQVGVGPCTNEADGPAFHTAMRIVGAAAIEELGSFVKNDDLLTPSYLPYPLLNRFRDIQRSMNIYDSAARTSGVVDVIATGLFYGESPKDLGVYSGISSSLVKDGSISYDQTRVYVATPDYPVAVQRGNSTFGAPIEVALCATVVTQQGECGPRETIADGTFKYSVQGFSMGRDYHMPPQAEFFSLRMQVMLFGFDTNRIIFEGRSGEIFYGIDASGRQDVKTITFVASQGKLQYKLDTYYNYGNIAYDKDGKATVVPDGSKAVTIKVSYDADGPSLIIDHIFDASDMAEVNSWVFYDPTVVASMDPDAWVPASLSFCSPSSCNELGWSDKIQDIDDVLNGQPGVPLVCGGTVGVKDNYSCMAYSGVPFAHAVDACAQAGARLCSESEILALEGAGICPIELDAQPVWTSTPCALPGGREGVMVASVGDNWDEPTSVCVDRTATLARSGKCCADVVCTACERCSSESGEGCMVFDSHDVSVTCQVNIPSYLSWWQKASLQQYCESETHDDHIMTYCPSSRTCDHCLGGCLMSGACSLTDSNSMYDSQDICESAGFTWCFPETAEISFTLEFEANMPPAKLQKDSAFMQKLREIGSMILFGNRDSFHLVLVALSAAGNRRLQDGEPSSSVVATYTAIFTQDQASTFQAAEKTDAATVVDYFNDTFQGTVQVRAESVQAMTTEIESAAPQLMKSLVVTQSPTVVPTPEPPTATLAPTSSPTPALTQSTFPSPAPSFPQPSLISPTTLPTASSLSPTAAPSMLEGEGEAEPQLPTPSPPALTTSPTPSPSPMEAITPSPSSTREPASTPSPSSMPTHASTSSPVSASPTASPSSNGTAATPAPPNSTGAICNEFGCVYPPTPPTFNLADVGDEDQDAARGVGFAWAVLPAVVLAMLA